MFVDKRAIFRLTCPCFALLTNFVGRMFVDKRRKTNAAYGVACFSYALIISRIEAGINTITLTPASKLCSPLD